MTRVEEQTGRGGLGQLLRETNGPREFHLSLFDSENKYEPWLAEAFANIDRATVP